MLFPDLKDSTELIEGLNPEEAQKLLDPALHLMMEAVQRYEGTVNQVLGDGIMALFGAPLAHEDHAIRACYAALAMQDYTEAVRRSQGIAVRMRVGLNSGEVVVHTISNDLHFELVGASAIRSRLQAAATRGLTRFVGRQAELAVLRQCLERAGAGHGQVAVVVGEAGVGKSRLV
jgi:class 3 adenylate cyclase